MTTRVFARVLASLLMLQVAAGLFVYLEEGKKRCFLEEVPPDVLVVGKFNTIEVEQTEEPSRISIPKPPNPAQADPSLGIRIVVTDPDSNVVMSKSSNLEGRFAFTSNKGGEYIMCFMPNTSRWFGAARKMKFEVTVNTGANAVDYDQIAKLEHLNGIELSVRRLGDRVAAIRAEQSYQRWKESAFRDLQELICERVAWWSVFEILILVAAGVWEIMHLRSFFLKKKLV